MEDLMREMEAAGYRRLPAGATNRVQDVEWSKDVPSTDGDARSLLVTAEPFPGDTVKRGMTIITVLGSRWSPSAVRAHVRITMTEDVDHGIDGSFDAMWVVQWFEQEIGAALNLLGRGPHE